MTDTIETLANPSVTISEVDSEPESPYFIPPSSFESPHETMEAVEIEDTEQAASPLSSPVWRFLYNLKLLDLLHVTPLLGCW